MPRNYTRKDPNRSVVTNSQLDAAKILISQGASQRKAAAQVGIRESTLRKRLKAGSAAFSLGRFSATFTVSQEEEIFGFIRRCEDLYYGLNMASLRKLIYEYAEANRIPHQFNKSSKMAGRDWVYGFLGRHPDLKLRQSSQTSAAKSIAFNKNPIETFYDNLEALCNKHKFPPSRIFNMDESSINTVPQKIPNVMSIKGKKLVGKIGSAERGQTITLVWGMSATGNFVPPAFIFPRKRMKGHLLNNGPTGSIGMVSDSGFINEDLFLEYLHHFKENVQPTKDNPVLLILDNHSSHLSLGAMNYCRDNGINMLTLPPNNGHKMQPLDRGFFGPLKIRFAYECDKWLSEHPGRVIGQTEMAHLVNEAFQKAATLINATTGFRASGIWPINRNIVSNADSEAILVTEMNPTPNTDQASWTAAASAPLRFVQIDDPLWSFNASDVSSNVQASASYMHQPDLRQIAAAFLSAASNWQSASDYSSATEATTSSTETSVALTNEEFLPLSSVQSFPKATAHSRQGKGLARTD